MMATEKRVARTIAGLILLQMASGPLVNFVLLVPISRSSNYLVNAAAHAQQLGLGALLGLAMGALSVGIAIAVWPLLVERSRRMALWFVVLAAVGLSSAALESLTVLCMLSLSQAHAAAGAANGDQFAVLADELRSARYWAHYLRLIIEGCTLIVLYASLLRFALVPRAFAGFGLAAAALMLIAVTMPIFGNQIVFLLLLPLGLSQLALVVWLPLRGLHIGGAEPAHARA
jgi:hypothetical protein